MSPLEHTSQWLDFTCKRASISAIFCGKNALTRCSAFGINVTYMNAMGPPQYWGKYLSNLKGGQSLSYLQGQFLAKAINLE